MAQRCTEHTDCVVFAILTTDVLAVCASIAVSMQHCAAMLSTFDRLLLPTDCWLRVGDGSFLEISAAVLNERLSTVADVFFSIFNNQVATLASSCV